jgi:hypothetical protein
MKRVIQAALVATVSAALLWGCQRESSKKKPAPGAQPAAKTANNAPAAAPAKPAEPITPPEVAEPAPPKGGRVVHLVYTSNVDGEVEPCG